VTITFTEEQERALATVQAVIDGHAGTPDGASVVMRGFAGTGKTTILQELVRRNAKHEVVLTAPTNKAVKVLAAKNRQAGLSTDCVTIYKLLGVKPGNGDEKRSLRKDGRDTSGMYDVVVVDECSMLGEEIFGHVQKALRHKVVVYVGDPQQLPPVGEELSPSFGVRRKAVLSTVMRQRAENPIVALTADIRSMIDAGAVDWDAFGPASGTDGCGIHRADGNLAGWIADAFTSPEFKADNDAFRYLAWTNRTTSSVNATVRALVYGADAPPFVDGERLLFRKPVVKSVSGRMSTVFSTDEEAVVRAVSVARQDGVACWDLLVRGDDGVSATVQVVHPDGVQAYRAKEAELKDRARSKPSFWPDYFKFTELFAEVQPVYAMTVHRSQGSTFDSVFLDLIDIRGNRNLGEMCKLLYVGASRPRRFLVV
jgi:exodeoxyribonuclease-5